MYQPKMITTTEEFLKHFHSLTGITIGERRKNLFLLLNNLNESHLNFARVQPRTPLEESFKLDTLIRFRKVPELIEVFKGGNLALIKKVLKASSWFLSELLRQLDTKTLVSQLFPHVSFNAKVKILNKLAKQLKDAKRADEIFLAVQERYGLYLAAKLLPCCGEELILHHLKSTRIEITQRQLLLIIDRNPNLIEQVFGALNEYCDVAKKYARAFRKIMRDDFGLYLRLIASYQRPNVHLGWRSTAKLVNSNRTSVIDEAEQVYDVLHRKQLLKSLGPSFATFYTNIFPGSVNSLILPFALSLVKLVPNNSQKLALIENAYQSRYGIPIWERSGWDLIQLLELMLPDEREAWMKDRPKPGDVPDIIWTCLMKTDKSLPIIQREISAAATEEKRASLVGCLAETCRINGDKRALIDSCKYLTTDLRNESASVLLCFLTTLKEHVRLDDFDETRWEHVNALMELIAPKDAEGYYHREYLSAYYQFRVGNGLCAKQYLRGLMERGVDFGSNLNVCYLPRNEKIHKASLIIYGELIVEVYRDDKLKERCMEFVRLVFTWNARYPANRIDLSTFGQVLDVLLDFLKSGHYHHFLLGIFPQVIRHVKQNQALLSTWTDVLIGREYDENILEFVQWLLKRTPLEVKAKLTVIIDRTIAMSHLSIPNAFWFNFRNYSHLGIPQRIAELCLDTVKSEDDSFGADTKKLNAIIALSFLMDPADFVNFASHYRPSTSVRDLKATANSEAYKTRQSIAGALKNLILPFLALESVAAFCKGDYVKFVRSSLYSASRSVPESRLVSFLDGLGNRSASVRRRIVTIRFTVLGKSEAQRSLERSIADETNPLARKFLLRDLFRFFCRNPDPHLWDLVRENVSRVDVNDLEAFDQAMEFRKVPVGFRSEFVQFCWKVLGRFPNVDNKVLGSKGRLLDLLPVSVISTLPVPFCQEIIEAHLLRFHNSSDFQAKIQEFASKYLIHAVSETERAGRLKWLVGLVKRFVDGTWCKCDDEGNQARVLLYQFVKTLCVCVMEADVKEPKPILELILDSWNEILTPTEAFDHFLYLQVFLILAERFPLEQTVEKLAQLCDSIVPEPILYHCVYQTLSSISYRFLDFTEEVRYGLIAYIMEKGTSANRLAMVALLLSPQKPTFLKFRDLHDRAIREIGSSSNAALMLSLDVHLKEVIDRNYYLPENENAYEENLKREHRHFDYMQLYSSSYCCWA